MKKNLLAGLLLLWACSVYGQKRIVDPVRSDFSYVAKFDRVEITGKRTVAEVRARGCQDLVRFFALLRIKPHAPPLVRLLLHLNKNSYRKAVNRSSNSLCKNNTLLNTA